MILNIFPFWLHPADLNILPNKSIPSAVCILLLLPNRYYVLPISFAGLMYTLRIIYDPFGNAKHKRNNIS